MLRLPGIALPFGSGPPQRWSLRPFDCQHIGANHKLIAAAARGLSGQRAIVMSAGSCLEVPLAVLARQFQQVELLGLDAACLRGAVQSLEPGLRRRVTARRADLSGLDEPFLSQVDAVLAQARDVDMALEGLTDLARNGFFQRRQATVPPAELVVASCVLSQLGIDLQRRIRHRFAERFPKAGDRPLVASRPWADAQLQLLRATQRAFLATLRAMTARDGRSFLSASMQVGLVDMGLDGQWSTPGWYRMAVDRHLGPMVGPGWKILLEAQWPWVASAPKADGRGGVVYRVEGLILSPSD